MMPIFIAKAFTWFIHLGGTEKRYTWLMVVGGVAEQRDWTQNHFILRDLYRVEQIIEKGVGLLVKGVVGFHQSIII
jgi:hypothetical protein